MKSAKRFRDRSLYNVKDATKRRECSDVVITKLTNSLRNIEISLFFLISITFQGLVAAESSQAVRLYSQL